MGDDKSNKKKFNHVDDIASITSQGVQGVSTMMGIVAETVDKASVIVPFTKFVPLIKEIGAIFDEIIDVVEAAEHNKRICKLLENRVQVADLVVKKLRKDKEFNKDFFINKNFLYLQDLTDIIKRIKKFISEVSQMKTLVKYIRAKNIEKTFADLCKEFDSSFNLLSVSIDARILEQLKSIDDNILKRSKSIEDELKELRADQDEFAKFLHEMVHEIGADVKDVRDDVKEIKNLLFSSTVAKVNTMSTTMEKLMMAESSQNQKKIDNIFQVNPLKISDYKQDDNVKSRKDGRVTKWFNIRIECDEVAFKTISENEDQKLVQNQVAILKELHDCQNIIKFYGITYDGNKRYLVTEWAEHGNLREYYTNNKDQFDLRLKLRMSLDIARGLNFLRAVEIVHRDIRAENILITINDTAKLANFKLSRYLNAATLNQKQNLERVRYCAPELLDRAPNYKYDQRCEVYSFGILLWEIAEGKVPYKDSNDIVDITEKVRNKMYREPFSKDSRMPEEFKQLEIEAVSQDPDFRPKITKMFEVLRKCVMKDLFPQDLPGSCNSTLNRKPSTPKRAFSIDQDAFALPVNLPDFESFKYMTLADAAKQHKLFKNGKASGDVETAYKCFEAYANNPNTSKRNQITAKYYKAVYISKGFAESPPNKDKIIAELFKEVADDEANDYPEAKVRYGDCLFNGRGVDKNESEALKYFEKAADDGVVVAMYNVGNMYYNGVGGKKDIERAKHYIELAVYNGYEAAIKFRNEYNF